MLNPNLGIGFDRANPGRSLVPAAQAQAARSRYAEFGSGYVPKLEAPSLRVDPRICRCLAVVVKGPIL